MRTVEPQKLVVTVVQGQDSDKLLQALTLEGYGSTVLGSTGGFMRRGNATILTLCGESAVDGVISLIRSTAERLGKGAQGRTQDRKAGRLNVWVLGAEMAGRVTPSTVR
ncbi:MAG: cyclic-di-AMP receptor [Chloroflexota bacterium]|nr:cyclic-di-AMP receptor [Chloroflexota bacterium]